MIFFVETLGQLHDAADAPVGVPWRNAPNPQNDHIDGPVQLEWVMKPRTTN